MSSLTSEWQLKTSENSIKYIVDINNFDKKVKTFRPGREIYSKDFMIGRSTFYILIYPGGETADSKDYVGIFLFNNSDWRLRATVSISIQNMSFSKKMDQRYFQSKSGFGLSEFAHHGRCNRGDLLTDDGVLQLEVNVELVEEEVVQSRDLTQENILKRFEKLEVTVHESARKINELTFMIQDLKNSNPQPSRPKVECPVCMELARPPMRLKQCGQGHIICDTCHSRSKKAAGGYGEATFNPDCCHTCRMVITGRPTALERILGLS